MLFIDDCNEASRIIPVFGFEEEMQVAIIGILFPLIISIITAIVFAKILAPLFLSVKTKLLASTYSNGYIVRDSSKIGKGLIFKRLIFVLLLTFGFLSFLLPAIDYEDWVSPEDICSYSEHGVMPAFNFTIFIALFGLAFPISIGLWSIAWAIEDAGLMHYSFMDDGYYEIEPIHTKYSSYLKGYAGISAILFVAQFVYEVSQQNSWGDAALIFAVLLIGIVCFFPAYIIFGKVLKDHSYLRNGMEEIKALKESDLK